MSGFKDLIHSTGYRRFMKTLLSYALIVFGLGLVFMLCKWPGGNILCYSELPINAFRVLKPET